MTQHIETKRKLAKKRVEEIKGFIRHLKIFIIVNGFLFILQKGWLSPLLPDWFPDEAYYFDWVNVNILVWGVLLAVHALTLYRHKFTFLQKWEAKHIQKYMDEDRELTKQQEHHEH